LPRQSHPDSRITVSGTKWLLDGTPLERRAALRTMYRDRAGWAGQLYLPEAEMRTMLRKSVDNDDPLLVHAVGDRTVELFLNAMESEAKRVSWNGRRVRIEHGDGLLPDLVLRARDLGVTVVQNPSHFTFKDIFVQRFGEPLDYTPARSLIESGISFALGSDGPMNPYLNIMFALIHPARPSEALTVEQAVEAYTRGSAYAEFEELDKGTIAVGKLADLAVLSRDIFTSPVSVLPLTESLLTIVGGEIVHHSGALADQ
jgi:predicted amidohydrolase YtcJ